MNREEMNREEFLKQYELHQKWLQDNTKGKRFEFHGVFSFKFEFNFKINLHSADLSWADLRSADLSWADLSWANLHSADLHSANLRLADLHSADLHSANLRSADLSSANLRSADLSSADLRLADLDYSSGLTFSCRSKNIKAGLRLAAQMAWHFRMIDFGDCEKARQAQEFLKELSAEFHLVKNGEVSNERN